MAQNPQRIPQLIRGLTLTLFRADLPNLNLRREANPNSNILRTFTKMALNILQDRRHLFRTEDRPYMELTLRQIAQRHQGRMTTIRDLLEIIDEGGFRIFWIENFSFDQLFRYIHDHLRGSSAQKLHYQYKCLTLWYFIQRFQFINGRLIYRPINGILGQPTEAEWIQIQRLMRRPQIRVIVIEDILSEEKGMEFCRCYLFCLRQYDIRNRMNQLPHLIVYQEWLEYLVERENHEMLERENHEMELEGLEVIEEMDEYNEEFQLINLQEEQQQTDPIVHSLDVNGDIIEQLEEQERNEGGEQEDQQDNEMNEGVVEMSFDGLIEDPELSKENWQTFG